MQNSSGDLIYIPSFQYDIRKEPRSNNAWHWFMKRRWKTYSLISLLGIFSLYVWYLVHRFDIIFEMKEIDVGFDHGAIQANFTIMSQFVPGMLVTYHVEGLVEVAL